MKIELMPDFPSIPLKRYFSLEELCGLACIEKEQFLEWQSQNNLNIGRGGHYYSRQDVLTLRNISPMIKEIQNRPRVEDLQAELTRVTETEVEVKKRLQNVMEFLEEVESLTSSE